MNIFTHTLGFPRIGINRELKKAQEDYWNKKINKKQLFSIGKTIRKKNWEQQAKLGIDLVPVGDFSWYDHVLHTSMMLGNIPKRFLEKKVNNKELSIDVLFKIARGFQSNNTSIPPSEMKKWFNTNYHYIVPEFEKQTTLNFTWKQLVEEVDEAISLGFNIKPILLGPVTYLWLGKTKEKKFCSLNLLNEVLKTYQEVLLELEKRNFSWIQIDEPIAALEISKKWLDALTTSYNFLKTKKKIILTTYFGNIDHNLKTIKKLPIQGLHIEVDKKNPNLLQYINENIPKNWTLSVGIINGKNIWKNDLPLSLKIIKTIIKKRKNLGIATSCSLIHVPIDLSAEQNINKNVKSWFSFALEKCHELFLLKTAIYTKNELILKEWSNSLFSRKTSQYVNNLSVQNELKKIKPDQLYQKTPYSIRRKEQKNYFSFPAFPITTIGSFPQTDKIRKLRLNFKLKNISKDIYEKEIKKNIQNIIKIQESLGIDVLVHGELERSDMVEYFGENLDGFIITSNGWVQSYGSRCVKPPIIVGDISRPNPITIKWMKYTQSITNKPIKGMLTGPVTILCWSFIREDIRKSQIANQLALALQKEVLDLEKLGIHIIQIDEPALREGLPLRKSLWKNYLNWATKAFRLTYYKTKNKTQIHTHMCYCEFDDIISAIIELDADVITLETSRSNLNILKLLKEKNYKNEVGPGCYDIHSTNIPSVSSIQSIIKKSMKYFSIEKIWINPDCGLKTRTWKEIELSLKNIIAAVKIFRNKSKIN